MAFQVFNFFMSIGLHVSLRSFQQAEVCAGFYILCGAIERYKKSEHLQAIMRISTPDIDVMNFGTLYI